MLDGSWGVLIQRDVKGEEAYRGERFRDHPRDVAGDPDLLNLTRPEVVARHPPRATSRPAPTSRRRTPSPRPRSARPTTGSRTYAAEMSLEGARLARQAADEAGGFVAGSVGPLNVSLSRLAEGRRPGFRAATFDQVRDAYAEQIARARRGRRRPAPDRDDLRHAEREGGDRGGARRRAGACRSGSRFTAIDQSGRNLSGQTVEAFWASVEHAEPLHRRRQLLARRRADAAVRRGPRAGRRHVRLLPPERRPAERLRRATTSSPATRAATSASSPSRASSTSSAAAAGRRPSTSRRFADATEGLSPRRVPKRARRARASAASSRSRSGPTPAS